MYAIDFRSCIPFMHVYKVETAGEPPTVDKPTASICFRKTGSSGLYLSTVSMNVATQATMGLRAGNH